MKIVPGPGTVLNRYQVLPGTGTKRLLRHWRWINLVNEKGNGGTWYQVPGRYERYEYIISPKYNTYQYILTLIILFNMYMNYPDIFDW